MSFSLDTTGLQARFSRVRAALPAAVELHVPLAATLLVEDPPYAAPMLDEVGPGPTADELLFDLGQTATAKAVGIAIVYDWVLGEVAHAHCQKCLDYAAGGPYTADFPDRPETVDTHSSSNPCFPGDTLVTSSAIKSAYGRRYSGPLVEIWTAGGKQLAGTPNHPILTRHGWLPLHLLNIGEHVVCGGLSQEGGLQDHDKQYVPAPLGEVYEALALSRHAERITGANHQFHGDGRDGQVHVITADRQLRYRRQTAVAEPAPKDILPTADQMARMFAGHRNAMQVGLTRRLAAPRRMCRGRQAQTLLSRCLRIPNPLCLRHSPQYAAAALDGTPDGLSSHSHALRHDVDRLAIGMPLGQLSALAFRQLQAPPRLRLDAACSQTAVDFATPHAEGSTDVGRWAALKVHADKVIGIGHRSFSGHVYNLETETGWYSANGIIAHNCHCIWAEREPTWEQTGPEIVATMGQDIWQDLSSAWGA